MTDKEGVLHRIRSEGLIPVVRISSAEEALGAAEALRKGGASVVEITMSVPGALRVVEELRLRFGDEVVVGAGTVLDPETARSAILAGARFIVSPTLNRKLVLLCRRYDVAVIPGAMTPTEILSAWEAGGDMVKVFPVELLGGPSYIRAIRGPLPQIPLMPTGGVNLQNAAAYVEAGAAALGVGGELVDPQSVSEGKWEMIAERVQSYRQAVKSARASVRGLKGTP